MQIEEVRLVGFGPLRDEELTLAQGMTVVYGPNESTKTTIHAGIYAALCGVRRARGAPARRSSAG